MVKKAKKVQMKSGKINIEIEQAQEQLLEQVDEYPHLKHRAKYRKASDDPQFQLDLSTEYIRSMGRYIH